MLNATPMHTVSEIPRSVRGNIIDGVSSVKKMLWLWTQALEGKPLDEPIDPDMCNKFAVWFNRMVENHPQLVDDIKRNRI